jgi:hypothetical protein
MIHSSWKHHTGHCPLSEVHFDFHLWRFGSSLYYRRHAIGCHDINTFFFFLLLLLFRTFRMLACKEPLDHRGGPEMVVVITVLMLDVQFSCSVVQGVIWNSRLRLVDWWPVLLFWWTPTHVRIKHTSDNAQWTMDNIVFLHWKPTARIIFGDDAYQPRH